MGAVSRDDKIQPLDVGDVMNLPRALPREKAQKTKILIGNAALLEIIIITSRYLLEMLPVGIIVR